MFNVRKIICAYLKEKVISKCNFVVSRSKWVLIYLKGKEVTTSQDR